MDKDFEVKEATHQLFGFFKRVTIQKDEDDEKRVAVTFEDPEGGQFVRYVKDGAVSSGGNDHRNMVLALRYMVDGWMNSHRHIVEGAVSAGGDALVIDL